MRDQERNWISQHQRSAFTKTFRNFALACWIRDGSIGDQKIKQSINDELDREAQRIISYMPKWEPATEEGTKMKSIVDIPIKFQISDFEK